MDKACRSKNMKQTKISSSPSYTKGMKAQTTYKVEEEEVCSLYALSSKQAAKVNMEVAGQELELIMDTGVSVTVISKEIYKKNIACPAADAGAYLAHFMGRYFQCSSGPPSQINMLYSNESIY